jgi:ribosomal protein L31E
MRTSIARIEGMLSTRPAENRETVLVNEQPPMTVNLHTENKLPQQRIKKTVKIVRDPVTGKMTGAEVEEDPEGVDGN